MSSLPQVAAAMQYVLTEVADAAAHQTGFVQRRRKVTGASFVQTLVFGWLAAPDSTLVGLTQAGVDCGVALSPQGLDQRFGPAAAALLEAVLGATVAQVVTADPAVLPLLDRFAGGVYVLDSTTVALPDALAAVWPGCGGRTAQGTQAALKLQVRLELRQGTLEGPAPLPGRTQDKSGPLQHAALPPDALRLADLGCWSLAVFRQLGAAGAYWLSRLNLQVAVFDPAGARLDLVRWLRRSRAQQIDVPVVLGAAERLPARLLGARVPRAVAAARRRKLRRAAKRAGKTPSAAALALAGWTLLVTNVPGDRLTVAEALVLATARWQIELLFKLWKSHGGLDRSRSSQPWRVLCEVYAKLIAVVLQHWVLIVGCWGFANRSLVQAAQAIRARALGLARVLPRLDALIAALRALRQVLTGSAQLNHRKTHPNTYQLLRDPGLAGLT